MGLVVRSALRAVRDPRRAWGILLKKARALAWDRYAAQVRLPRRIESAGFVHRHLRGLSETMMPLLEQERIETRPLAIDLQRYRRFLVDARYDRFPDYQSFYASVLGEKKLEHFAALELLQPQRFSDSSLVFMDVGSERSIVADIYQEMFDWQVYRQDLAYRPGVHGEFVGGDAGQIPLGDQSVHMMACYCAYEHFETDADVGLVREAQRILKPGGRLVILPLYLAEADQIILDPVVAVPGKVELPEGWEAVCVPKLWNRFLRAYSPSRLRTRILEQWTAGPVWLTSFSNYRELEPDSYLSFGLVLEKS